MPVVPADVESSLVFLAVEKMAASFEQGGVPWLTGGGSLVNNNIPKSNRYCRVTILRWQSSHSENVVIVLR